MRLPALMLVLALICGAGCGDDPVEDDPPVTRKVEKRTPKKPDAPPAGPATPREWYEQQKLAVEEGDYDRVLQLMSRKERAKFEELPAMLEDMAEKSKAKGEKGEMARMMLKFQMDLFGLETTDQLEGLTARKLIELMAEQAKKKRGAAKADQDDKFLRERIVGDEAMIITGVPGKQPIRQVLVREDGGWRAGSFKNLKQLKLEESDFDGLLPPDEEDDEKK